MGFLDYAWSVSLQKDNLKTRILIDPKIHKPTLVKNEAGFDITLPMPVESEEGTMFYLGHELPSNSDKKRIAGRLFRACVIHLTTHTLTATNDEYKYPLTSKHTTVETFSHSIANDAFVNNYITARYPDKLADLAFANSLAFAKMKPAERIFNPATRIMAALLSKVNIGTTKGKLLAEEGEAIHQMTAELTSLKEKIRSSLVDEEIKISEEINQTATTISQILESHGPVLEAPALQYTEQIGPTSIFTKRDFPSKYEIESIFRQSLKTLGGTIPSEDDMESCWRKVINAETLQAFNSWFHERTREAKILARIKEFSQWTRFKSVEFPVEDYTQYLRARFFLKGGSRRLLDSLRIAQDALDEDPRKEQGQLDMPAVIQKIASNSPRTDVFFQNEYLSKSYAWSILYDVSASMKPRGNYSRALAICVAEATKELLMDPGSWSFYAFSDRLYVLKAPSEAYSRRVRARIGGLKFEGLTYMPDAIQVAGEILSKRFDEQRFLVVLSDGWPHGYPNIASALSASIDALTKKGVIVIGVGLETERMNVYFKTSCAVYNQKDLVKKFTKIYVNASTAALEG